MMLKSWRRSLSQLFAGSIPAALKSSALGMSAASLVGMLPVKSAAAKSATAKISGRGGT
jgi:hypothetical protein